MSWTTPARASNRTSGSSLFGVGTWCSLRIEASPSTRPAAILVPPMSTASTTPDDPAIAEPSPERRDEVVRPGVRATNWGARSSAIAVESTADSFAWTGDAGPRAPVLQRPRDVVDACFPHAPGVLDEHSRRQEHHHHADESDDDRSGEREDHEEQGGDEDDGRPDAVPAGVAVDGLRAHAFGKFRILLVQGLLELMQNALFVLRERQLPRPPIPVSTPLAYPTS